MFGREYTGEENKFIRDNYKAMSDEEIATALGRTPRSIRAHRRLMGLSKGTGVPKKWSDKEIEFLTNNYETMTDKEIGETIKRSEQSVLHYRQRRGLSKPNRSNNKIPWTEEEKKYVRDHYETMSDEDVGKALNRTKKAIQNYRYKNKLTRKTEVRRPPKRNQTEMRAERSARYIALKLGIPLEKLREITHRRLKEWENTN